MSKSYTDDVPRNREMRAREMAQVRVEQSRAKAQVQVLVQNRDTREREFKRIQTKYADVVGAIPSSIFNSVHKALSLQKWLKAAGKSDAYLDAALAPLLSKKTAWTIRDYYRADYVLQGRPGLFAAKNLPQTSSISDTSKSGSLPEASKHLLEKAQSGIAEKIIKLSERVSTRDNRQERAHLQMVLANISRQLRLQGSGKHDKFVPAGAVQKAASMSTVPTLLMARTKYIAALINTLHNDGYYSTKPISKDKRQEQGLRSVSARNMLTHILDFGIVVNNRAVPISAFNPSLEAQIKKILKITT